MENKDSPEEQAKKPKWSFLVRDALIGLTAINQDLALFDYDNIVVRKDYKNVRGVRLLSGGAVGEDFLYSVLVGKGLLTAAVLGYPSGPGTRLILRAIQELNVGENQGILIVKQKDCEIFNFGLAAEIASKDLGVKVEILSVDDDQRVVSDRRSGGIVLLIKILGAMAEEGRSFDEIIEFWRHIVGCIATTVIEDSDDVFIPKKISLNKTTRGMIQKSISNLNLHPSLPVVVLINTPKNMNRLDEFALVKDVVQSLHTTGEFVKRIYLGKFCWSTSEKSSLTTMSVTDDDIIKYLDAPTQASGWQQLSQISPEVTIAPEIVTKSGDLEKRIILIKGPKFSDFQVKMLTTAVEFACDALISCERQLNIIDREDSEGNVGTRFKAACKFIKKELEDETIAVNNPKAFFKKIASILDTAIGGPMGAIYGVLFENLAIFFKKTPESVDVTPEIWIKAFGVAINSVEKYCIEEMQPRTMFLPLKTFETVLRQEYQETTDFVYCLGIAVSAAEIAAQSTRHPECDFADAGAHAVRIWMRAICEAVKFVMPQKQSISEK